VQGALGLGYFYSFYFIFFDMSLILYSLVLIALHRAKLKLGKFFK
jgi:hypothetical protein